MVIAVVIVVAIVVTGCFLESSGGTDGNALYLPSESECGALTLYEDKWGRDVHRCGYLLNEDGTCPHASQHIH